ncbi:MAG: hypothetical protein ACLFTQ_03630 [Candidatus Aenigmatarchaeota archaeon]
MPGEEIIESGYEAASNMAQNPGLLSEIGSAVYEALSSAPGKMALTLGSAYGLLELGGCAVASASGSEYDEGLPRSPEKKEEDIREDLTTIDNSAYGPISSMAIDHYAEK